MLNGVRQYFAQQDVLEVASPLLLEAPVTEPNIDSLVASSPQSSRHWYLRTSPEYPLKRLLAAGWPDLFEIGRVFRDGELGRRHQPEFTMLEWYRLGFELDGIVADTEAVIQTALTAAGCDTAPQTVRRTYDDWLEQYCGLRSDCDIATLRSSIAQAFPESLNDDRDALLNFIFDTQVAAQFPRSQLSIVSHFPASQAALARIDQQLDRALRFEVYLGPVEIANGFVELTDAIQQRTRFDRDNQHRIARGQAPMPIDDAFLAALETGLPDCSGVAIGIDRLLMHAIGSDEISDVTLFPHQSHDYAT